MGVLGSIMFWKRKDELGLGDELALPKGLPGDDLSSEQQGFPKMPQMQEPRIESFENARMLQQPYPQQQAQQPYYGYNKDLELIAAKLDSLRATLDNINQRIANLERVAYGEDERKRGW